MRAHSVFHVLPRWGDTQLDRVEHGEIQRRLADLAVDGQAGASVRKAYGVLSSILDLAVRERRLASNPSNGVNLPALNERRRRYLTAEQVVQLADSAGAGRLEWNSPKNHERRTVPLPRFLAAELTTHLANRSPDDLSFAGTNGGVLRNRNARRDWFNAAARAIGEPGLTPHELRHTAASLAVSAGANVKAVQRMLGHASAAMTLDRYADLFDDDLHTVAERLDAVYLRAAHANGDVIRLAATLGARP
jgi:site-specific recombinase XerC